MIYTYYVLLILMKLLIYILLPVSKMINILNALNFYIFMKISKLDLLFIKHQNLESFRKIISHITLTKIFNQKIKEEDLFDCSQINNDNYTISQINNNREIINTKLKKLFTLKPICSLKRNFVKKENK